MVLSMGPCKIIFHIQVQLFTVFLQPCNPTHRTETGTANRWAVGEGGAGVWLLIANHLDHYDGPIRNIEDQSNHIYYTHSKYMGKAILLLSSLGMLQEGSQTLQAGQLYLRVRVSRAQETGGCLFPQSKQRGRSEGEIECRSL